ncbi:PAS domain S-box protein [Benzoatithermus flavus]|uniref:histidine kinase n=1 Tax=Benzoatithermus flavus TaxID=3108223 RepID=A0ABU8XPY5_9PROT
MTTSPRVADRPVARPDRREQRWSLSARLLVLLAAALVPVVAIAVYSQVELRREYRAEVHRQALQLLGGLESEQEQLLEEIRHLLATVRQTRIVREQDMAECARFMDRLRPDYPAYLDLYVTDRNGVIRCSTDAASLGITIGDRVHVRRAIETDGLASSGYILKRSNGRPALPFAIPYHDDADRVAGVVTVLLDTRWLEDYASRRSLPENATFVLADENGTVLARAPARPDLVGVGLPAPWHSLLHASGSGVEELPGLDGVDRIVAYSPPVPGTGGLLVAVTLDREKALAPIDRTSYRMVGLLALILALVATILWWGTSRLVRAPVAALVAATERWRRGDLAVRAGLTGVPREIAALGDAFDAMLEDLEAQQARLRRAEARYRSIVDTAVDAMAVIDEHGIVQSFNPAAERTFGYQADEVIGRNVSMLMPEPHRSNHDGYLAHYRRTGERKVIGIGREVEGRRKDGSIFPLELAIAEWRVDGERFFTGIMRDITERRETQRRLEESNRLLTTIIESIPEPVFVRDREGRFILVNSSTCALLGRDAAAVLGTRDRDYCPPAIADRIEASDREVLETGRAIVLEQELQDSTGQRRTCLSTKAPLRDASGAVVGVIGIAFDISERKRSEEHLHAAKAEAERANLAKSKFLAAASHDLRQPVQSLTLFLDLLKVRLRDHPAAVVLGNMEQALEALGALLDSLLDVSKLDAGLVVAQPAPIPLAPLLERLAAEYAPRAEAAGLRLRVVSPRVVVRSDPVLLERMLRNLIENALRYTKRGGVLVGCRRRGEHVRIEVVDTGIGIASDQFQDVFEEFYQVGNPERDRRKGLGLGLAVVRRLSRLLDHPVELHSRPGRGSTFAILVPRATVVELPQPPARFSGGDGGFSPGVVMVIEDDALIRIGLEAMIEDWGHTVLAAASVDEAIVMTDREPLPDAVVTDYRLQGGRTGLDAVLSLQAKLGRPIPATIVTGDTAPERLAEAKRGGFRLLHKPVGPLELKEAVTAMLRESRKMG